MNKRQCERAISYIQPGTGFEERTIARLYLSQKQRSGKRHARKPVYIVIPVAAAAVVVLAVFLLPHINGGQDVSLPPASSNAQAVAVYSPVPSAASSPAPGNADVRAVPPSPSSGNAGIHNISTVDKIKLYTGAAELYADADIVFTGTCLSARPVFQNEMLYTLAQYRVGQVFKGDVQPGGDIFVVEMGGATTYGDYAENCISEKKPGDGNWEDYHSPGDPLLLRSPDGAYVSETGDVVLLFAGDTRGFLKSVSGPLYSALGGIDGKFYDQGGGVYARALPASTDRPIFSGDKSAFGSAELYVSLDELQNLTR